MRTCIRVAEVAELPPGKGVTVHVGSRSVTVYNTEGRYHAAVVGACPRQGTPDVSSCSASRAHYFDATVEDSPARHVGHDARLHPRAVAGYVVLEIDGPLG